MSGSTPTFPHMPLWCTQGQIQAQLLLIYFAKLVAQIFRPVLHLYVGRDSSVDTATCYDLDGPGIENRWGETLRTRPDRLWVPPNGLYNGYRVSFPGVKRQGRVIKNPPHLAPTLKKE
jgi:hypothetical protein